MMKIPSHALTFSYNPLGASPWMPRLALNIYLTLGCCKFFVFKIINQVVREANDI